VDIPRISGFLRIRNSKRDEIQGRIFGLSDDGVQHLRGRHVPHLDRDHDSHLEGNRSRRTAPRARETFLSHAGTPATGGTPATASCLRTCVPIATHDIVSDATTVRHHATSSSAGRAVHGDATSDNSDSRTDDINATIDATNDINATIDATDDFNGAPATFNDGTTR